MVHNENHVRGWWLPADGYDPTAKMLYVRVSGAITSPYLTSGTKQELDNIIQSKDRVRLMSLDTRNEKTGSNFLDRLAKTKKCQQNIYYRKMSAAEWADIQMNYKKKPLEAALNFIDKDNYRVWISSSKLMVKSFINANATTAADVIVKFTMKNIMLISSTLCEPHQESGVQHKPSAIAVHRETFAHIGNFNKTDLHETRSNSLDHNLGFTNACVKSFHDNLESYELYT